MARLQSREGFRTNVEMVGLQETLRDYRAATGKAAEYVAIRYVKNVLFHLLHIMIHDDGMVKRATRKGGKAPLDLTDPENVRLVATLLHARAGLHPQGLDRKGRRTLGRVSVENGTNSKGKTKYKRQMFYAGRGKYYTREYARAWAAAHTRMRANRKGFVRTLPRDLITAVQRYMKSLGMNAGGKPSGYQTPKMKAKASGSSVKLTSGDVVKASATIWYNYVSARTSANLPSTHSAQGYEHILNGLLPHAAKLARQDMREYTLRKWKKWDNSWDEFVPSRLR